MTIERVTYPARNIGTRIVANLFKPAGFPANAKYAATVVTHPFGGVKEQTAGLYALHLTGRGFLTLAYDAVLPGALASAFAVVLALTGAMASGARSSPR